MEMTLAILGCVMQVPVILALQKKRKRDKGTLRTYNTAEMPV